jgi:hypothetical protein
MPEVTATRSKNALGSAAITLTVSLLTVTALAGPATAEGTPSAPAGQAAVGLTTPGPEQLNSSAPLETLEQAGPGSAPGGLVTVPPLDGASINTSPQVILIPGATGPITLTDRTGAAIAPTGNSAPGEFRPPTLLAGTYQLTAGAQSAQFRVTGPGGRLADIGWEYDTPPTPWPAILLTVSLLLLAGTLAAVRRKHAAALVLLAAAAAGVWAWSTHTAEPTTRTVSECGTDSGRTSPIVEECRMERATSLLAAGNLNQVITEMHDVPSCHDFGHEIGRRAYALIDDRDTLARPEKTLCTEGYLHGLMYGAAMYSTDEQYRTFLTGFCQRLPDIEGLSLGSCAHGVGHGWTMRTNGRLSQAQDECRAVFAQPGPLQTECTGAALMEFIQLIDDTEGRPQWLLAENREPAELCRQVPVENTEWCYTGIAMSTGWTEATGPAYAAGMIDTCLTEHDARRDNCLRGVVRTFPSALGLDPGKAAICLKVPADGGRTTCASSYAYHLAYAVLNTDQADAVCQAAGLPAATCRGPGSAPEMLAPSRPTSETRQ